MSDAVVLLERRDDGVAVVTLTFGAESGTATIRALSGSASDVIELDISATVGSVPGA